MDFDNPKVYGDTSITDGLVFNYNSLLGDTCNSRVIVETAMLPSCEKSLTWARLVWFGNFDYGHFLRKGMNDRATE